MTAPAADPERARLEALARWARELPDPEPGEDEARLVEAAGGPEAARELLRRCSGTDSC